VTHLSEEDLVLHHFGEGEASVAGEAHLAQCAECREALAALRRDLGAVSLPEPPARGEDYGAQVWARIQPQIQPRVRRPVFARRAWVPLAMAASLAIAFLLGRHWPHDPPPAAVTTAARERILLVAVGDHLERSAMLLVELANAGDDGKPVDISAQQEWAEELVGENRLYRQTLVRSGEPGAASLLDELERLLVEVAHRPSSVSPAELSEIRGRIESRGLLFRVRVIESQVREKEKATTKAQGRGTNVVS
jgi:anti-sigma factor RsiW